MTDRPSGSDPRVVPTPPEPLRRRERLPSQCRPSPQDDPDAHARIEAVLHHPNYRRAEDDPDFLATDTMRGARLQLDYAKAELILEAHGIAHTIVVFGGTRVCEPCAAEARLRAAEAALARDPGNADAARALAVASRIVVKSRYYDIAREFGRLVSRANHDADANRAVVLTGGGPGIMEAANRGAFDVEAKSIGLNISLPNEQYPNAYVTPDLCLQFHYFSTRKLHFLLRARALVVFPGGYGTLDELFEVLTLIQTRKIKPIPVVLVGETFWRRAIDFDFLVEEGVVDLEDRDLFWFAETAEEIWRGIQQWLAKSAARAPETSPQGVPSS